MLRHFFDALELKTKLLHYIGNEVIIFKMFKSILKSLGIGQKLLLFFSIGLLLIIISIGIAIVNIKNIDSSRESLTESSIPSLIGVNALSKFAIDLLESSNEIGSSTSLDELDIYRDSSITSIFQLKNELLNLKKNNNVENINILLNKLETNLNKKYKLIKSKLNTEIDYDHDLHIMRETIEIISQKINIFKINSKTESLNNFKNYNSQNNIVIARKEIDKIDLISELITRTAQVKKDLLSIDEANSKDSVLNVEQDFDHSLRIMTRTVVQHPELNLREQIGSHILTLIEHGQDTPDIFNSRMNLVDAQKQFSKLHAEVISLTVQLNIALNQLSEEVKFETEKSATNLHEIIKRNLFIFYFIAIVSVIIFGFIIWKFVYQDIVLRLLKLSSATKRLSKSDLNFEIDTSGNDEFSNLANAIDTLKNQTKERMKINEQLRKQSLLLKRSNEDLGLFAYVASHDLQEPLRAISSYSQLLSKRYSNKLDKEADKFIDYIVVGCSRMESLIDGLLRFSRVDTQESEKESIWIDTLLQDIKNDLKVRIDETFTLITWDDMPTIYADRVQIKTVFQNIISNALKYNHSKPPKIHIKAEKEEDFWKFYVSDNGIGIEKQYYDKIFVIFKRLHSRDKFSGTGIGLSICKKIVERHGGSISLQSKTNEGTTFIFTLPVDDRFRIESISDIAA